MTDNFWKVEREAPAILKPRHNVGADAVLKPCRKVGSTQVWCATGKQCAPDGGLFELVRVESRKYVPNLETRQAPRPVPYARKLQIIGRYSDGMRPTEIATELHMPKARVWAVINEYKTDNNGKAAA